MQYKWLNKKNNKKLIVFFNGWGMDEKIVSHLDCTDYDVLVFFDYRNLDAQDFDFSSYQTKNLIAWSMGVCVSSYFYDKYKDFDKFIAINGTQKPIDDNYGIPVMIYNLMVENFNELSCGKFMSKISSEFDLKQYTARSTAALKEELIELSKVNSKQLLKFDKAIVSKKDRIMPYKNQLNYWKNQSADIIENQGSHYVFNQFCAWEDIL